MSENNDILNGVDLEELCPSCKGAGGSVDCYGDYYRCPGCNDAGYVPTEFGEKVLALMRHNFKPMLQDATHD